MSTEAAKSLTVHELKAARDAVREQRKKAIATVLENNPHAFSLPADHRQWKDVCDLEFEISQIQAMIDRRSNHNTTKETSS